VGPGDVATLRAHVLWLVVAGVLAAGGVAVRLNELGTWGLSNDEAWVALSTRVEGAAQWWLAISMTPVAWAALVKLAALVSSHEASLRAVPLAFGCLAMAVAFRLGARFAAHPLGGLLALAAVAFDPLAIGYAKILKQYTAEAFFCLLAFERAAALADRPARRELALLLLVLVAGLGFANSQLLVAPALLAALILDAWLRRDVSALRDLLLSTVGVGACAGLYFWLVVLPRMPPASDPYWAAQVYVPFNLDAPAVAWKGVSWSLGQALGTVFAPLAMIGLAGAVVLRRPFVLGAALTLLLVEMVGLSMLHVIAVSQPRILLFLTTLLATLGAAAVGLAAVGTWTRPILGVAVSAALAVAAYDFARVHARHGLSRSILVEDAGPLVRRIERERRPRDVVLVHRNTGYVFAYYQTATPVLAAWNLVSVGYVPRPPDAQVVFVDDRDLEARARAAADGGARVWFVGSRLREARERRLREALARVGTMAIEERRSAVLVLVQRTDRVQ
jgi:hypothetical protein